MKKTQYGSLILRGYSIYQIREQYPEFPSNPTVEYFIGLGYSQSTAKAYCRQVLVNNKAEDSTAKVSINDKDVTQVSNIEEEDTTQEFRVEEEKATKINAVNKTTRKRKSSKKGTKTRNTSASRAKNKFERVQNNNAKMQLELKKVKAEKFEIQSELEKSKSENCQMQLELEKAKNEILQMQAEHDKTKFELKKVERENLELSNYCTRKEKELNNQINQLKANNEALRTKVKNMETSNLAFWGKNGKDIKSDNAGNEQDEDLNKLMQNEKFILSEAIDCNNVLLDTCALEHKECLELIERAKAVTVIYATLQELDKIAHNKSNTVLSKNIRDYTKKILKNPQKYFISSFEGSSGYVDDALVEYLSLLPEKIRPTLITADKNLAAKLMAKKMQFVLYLSE